MTWIWIAVAGLVAIGSVLAVSEASLTRITRSRVMALKTAGRSNAGRLEKIEADLPRFLNSVYLAVMLVQNGSAVLVAIVAEHSFAGTDDGWWIALVSAAFTIAYFVLVEAMSKTFGVLHADRAALLVAPLVYYLGRALAIPTRALIGLANVLLPGKGLKEGPFVEEEIRSMAAAGYDEGVLQKQEAELIDSVFDFGDRLVKEVMVPRPDIVAAPAEGGISAVRELIVKHGHSRMPVYGSGIDDVRGVVHVKDLLSDRSVGGKPPRLESILRAPLFVPETNRAAALLREMQSKRVHIAIVTDEYGSTAGLVTLEDLLEELVGEIADEFDQHTESVEKLEDGRYRVPGTMLVESLNRLLERELPHEDWTTVAGLVLGLTGNVPAAGTRVEWDGVSFVVDKLEGRRITRVTVEKFDDSDAESP